LVGLHGAALFFGLLLQITDNTGGSALLLGIGFV
jgi:hypothetical protein